MATILETQRTFLREKVDEDLSALMKIIHPKGDATEEAHALRWLNWCKDSYKEHGFGLWAVIDKKSNEMMGTAGVSMQFIDDDWRPEIGYHLRKDFHRQGYGKEITAAIRDYFFNNFGFAEVYSYMNIDNVASYKTAEAMGMTYLHDYQTPKGELTKVYRITRDEWCALKQR